MKRGSTVDEGRHEGQPGPVARWAANLASAGGVQPGSGRAPKSHSVATAGADGNNIRPIGRGAWRCICPVGDSDADQGDQGAGRRVCQASGPRGGAACQRRVLARGYPVEPHRAGVRPDPKGVRPGPRTRATKFWKPARGSARSLGRIARGRPGGVSRQVGERRDEQARL